MPTLAAQVRLVPACAAIVLYGCTSTGGGDSTAIPEIAPAITDASVACEVTDARWTFQVTTDAWTGNGQVLLSTDGEYVEKHTMYSIESAADGTSDELELNLSVVPDWRDVTLGASTVFNCSEPDLTGIVRVWTRDGSTQADCRAFGSAPERWAGWSAGATCDTPLAAE